MGRGRRCRACPPNAYFEWRPTRAASASTSASASSSSCDTPAPVRPCPRDLLRRRPGHGCSRSSARRGLCTCAHHPPPRVCPPRVHHGRVVPQRALVAASSRARTSCSVLLRRCVEVRGGKLHLAILEDEPCKGRGEVVHRFREGPRRRGSTHVNARGRAWMYGGAFGGAMAQRLVNRVADLGQHQGSRGKAAPRRPRWRVARGTRRGGPSPRRRPALARIHPCP